MNTVSVFENILEPTIFKSLQNLKNEAVLWFCFLSNICITFTIIKVEGEILTRGLKSKVRPNASEPFLTSNNKNKNPQERTHLCTFSILPFVIWQEFNWTGVTRSVACDHVKVRCCLLAYVVKKRIIKMFWRTPLFHAWTLWLIKTAHNYENYILFWKKRI